jgi:PAS domain S-box-containing protein
MNATCPIPENEQERLSALRSYRILDTPREPQYDDLAKLAASICGTPIGLITLIDSDRQWFKSGALGAVTETPRHIAFCNQTILGRDILVVRDARIDERFAENPLVTGSPHIGFYAGIPLINPDGLALGTLCVVDFIPRDLTEYQREALRVLSSQIVSELELRKAKAGLINTQENAAEAIRALKASEEFKRRLIACSRDCIKVLDLEGRLLFMNEGGIEALEICDFASVANRSWFDFWEGADRVSATEAVEAARGGGTGRFVGYFPTVRFGKPRWWDVVVSPIQDAEGNPERILALSRDVTERHIAEETFRSIVIGTASATGNEFFPSLVRNMSAALRVRYAFVTQCDDQKHARVLAFWNSDRFGENFEFDIEDTPCMKVLQGEVCHYREGLQGLFPLDGGLADLNAQSYLGVPMLDPAGHVIGHIALLDDKPMERDDRAIDVVKIFAARASAELKRQRAETDLQKALEQVRILQKKLEAENLYLQEEIRKEHNFEEIIGHSPALLEVLRRVEAVASTDATALISGETGCGKELIARAIHNRSARRDRPLVKVNCGAIPSGLVESELFGHVKGAFTGALDRRTGRFELADGGTLFLDEVSEIPFDTQVKLLRVLQEHEFEPVGSSRTIRVNVRIIAASNRDLEKAIKEERFRQDLYYRLNVVPLLVPPLRQRRSDIPLLATFFMERFARQFGKAIKGIAQETMDILSSYLWPGNIRELQNVIERAVVLSSGPVLRLGSDLLPMASSDATSASDNSNLYEADGHTLQGIERRHIIDALNQTEWVIEGARGAAKILGLNPNTLRSRMKKLGIKRPSAGAAASR